MIDPYAFAMILFVFIVAAYLYLKKTSKSAIERLLEDYQRSFPNGCPVCGYARFGLREFGIPFNPDPHDCPEAHRDHHERELYPVMHNPSALTIEEAKEKKLCRFCELGQMDGPGLPFHFNFGREYAHEACLKENAI